MKISSAKFQQEGSISVTLSDGGKFTVPDEMANRDRRALQDWLDQGNKIDPADPPAPPQTPRQRATERLNADPLLIAFARAFAELRGRGESDAQAKALILSKVP